MPRTARSTGERLACAATALDQALADADAQTAAKTAGRALGDGALLAEIGAEAPSFYIAANPLLYAEQLREVSAVYDQALANAQRQGSPRGFMMASAWRAAANYRRGQLPAAIADATASLQQRERTEGMTAGVPVALGFLIEALIDQNDVATAQHTLDRHAPGPEPGLDSILDTFLAFARARLSIARGHPRSAFKQLQAVGTLLAAWGVRNPTVADWQPLAAEVLVLLGEHDHAREIAGEALARALAFGAPGPLGLAQRAAALAEQGQQRVDGLSAAVATLQRSQRPLEHARALLDLGRAQRHTANRSAGRQTLRTALDRASTCAALALVLRARA